MSGLYESLFILYVISIRSNLERICVTIIRVENTNGGVAVIFYGSVAERALSAAVVISAIQVGYCVIQLH